VKFDSSASWSAYGFASTRSRQAAAVKANDRIGVGALSPDETLLRSREASDGHLGPGAKVGTSFLYSERTSFYLNYSLETSDDNGLLLHGSQGKPVSA